MSIPLNECLSDLNIALQYLEPLCQQGSPSGEMQNCRRSLLTLRASLTERLKRKTPLKWLRLRTGIYNPLMRAGYQTVESVACLTSAQLLAIPKIGIGYRDEIFRALENWHQEPRTLSHQDSHFEL
jgi:DNA-directed RNA polymerase alpha subunit